jgi:hypothetical protein
VRRPSLNDVRRTTSQFLRTALTSHGIEAADFGRLEAELAERKAKGELPRLVKDKKGRGHTSDGVYRFVRTNASVWTASKLKENDKFAKVAEAKSLHLCWELVQRLIILEGRSAR